MSEPSNERPRRVWIREPGEELARCQLTHLERQPIDVARAREQHAAFARALEELGCELVRLPRLDDRPDAVFVEDTALLLGDFAVLGRPGVTPRRGEVASVAAALEADFELVRLPDAARLEGGDVLRADDILFVGQSTRTNHAGLKALAHAVLEADFRVKAVEVRGCLHLETAATDLGDGRILIRPAWLEPHRLERLEWIEADPREPFGSNVLRVGRTILASSAAPRTNERLRRTGLDVRELELSEFHKAEAGVTCLALMDRG